MRSAASIVRAFVLAIGTAVALPAQQVTASYSPGEQLMVFLRAYLGDADDSTTRITAVGVKTQDGKSEEIVYVSGRGWCGSGGCTMLVLEPKDSTFSVLGRVTIVQLPIRVLPSMHHGHPDIVVLVQGGGIRAGYEAVLSFNGKRYPPNPSVRPATRHRSGAKGNVIIASTDGSVPLYH